MVEVFHTGDLFGEIGVIDGGVRTASAVVEGIVRLATIRGGSFLQILKSDPALGVELCRLMARRLRRTFDLFQDATFERLEVRLARQIVYLAEREGRQVTQGLRLGHRLQQGDLADLLGTTTRSIIDILNAWRTGGIVIYDSNRAHLTVCDMRAMRRWFAEKKACSPRGYHSAARIGPEFSACQPGSFGVIRQLTQPVQNGQSELLGDPEPGLVAVRMAVEMRGEVGAFIAKWRIQGYELGFGIGSSLGYATVGLIGIEERSQYTAIGTVTNLASRLCGEAADGQILIDNRVATTLGSSFKMEDCGELPLKGLRRPIHAFNVSGLRGYDNETTRNMNTGSGGGPGWSWGVARPTSTLSGARPLWAGRGRVHDSQPSVSV
jgi:hypothetical protein